MNRQLIHDSAFVGSYIPRARLPVELKWNMVDVKDKKMLETGEYITFARTLASDLENAEKLDDNLQSVKALISTGKLSRPNITFDLILTLLILEQM